MTQPTRGQLTPFIVAAGGVVALGLSVAWPWILIAFCLLVLAHEAGLPWQAGKQDGEQN